MEGEKRLKSVLEAMEVYCKPKGDNWTSNTSTRNVQNLEDVIDCNGEHILELMSIKQLGGLKIDCPAGCKPLSSTWRYVCLGITLLTELKETLLQLKQTATIPKELVQAPPLPPDSLSVQQEKTVQQCVQLIITFGILPYLAPNLGIPLQKRSTFSHLITSEQLEEETKYERSVFMTQSFLNLLQTSPHLNPLLISSHLMDLLAVLFQLAFAPVKKPEGSDAVTNANAASFRMTPAFYARIQADQSYFKEKLEKLLDSIYPPLAIESLLWLQGPSPNAAKVLRDAPSPAPLWLRLRCGSYITRFLLKPNGLLSVIQAVVSSGPETTGGGQKQDALAHLVATPPKGMEPPTYFQKILPQVLSLPKEFVKLAGEILRIIAEKCPEVSQKCWDDLMMALKKLRHADPLPTEAELSSTIELAHHYLVYGSDPSSELTKFLRPYTPIFFALYAFALTTVLHLKTMLQDILVKYLTFDASPLQSLRQLSLEVTPQNLHPHPELSFKLGSEMGIIPELNSDHILDDDIKSDALIQLIRNLNQPSVTCDFFLSLLKDLTDIIQIPEPQMTVHGSHDDLLAIEQKVAVYGEQLARQLLLVRLISALAMEKSIQHAVTENMDKALHFCRLTLERGCVQAEDGTDSLPGETLCMTMAVIGILGANGLSWATLSTLEPLLSQLSRSHADDNVRKGAEELRTAIVTQGAGPRTSAETLGAKGRLSLFEQTWNELHDPLIPVKGHALLQLGKLIKQRDPETLKHIQQCFDKLNECLRHEDSYVYLMAVEALSLLADYQSDTALSILLGQFDAEDFSQRSTEVKLTIGEVLVRVTRLLGPMTPKYKAELLNCFLRGCRDPDALIRASSLSNLGEVCGLLGFSLGATLYEVFECISSCARYDPSIEVRRSAWMVVHLMLKGLNQDALTILQPVLRDLHRALRQVLKTEPDEAIRTHVSIALDYLDAIVLQFLNPPTQTSKTIYITRPLP